MPSAGFEPVIPSTTQFQTYALDRTATGICVLMTREDELERNVEGSGRGLLGSTILTCLKAVRGTTDTSGRLIV